MRLSIGFAILLAGLTVPPVTGCKPMEPNRLDELETVTFAIKDRTFNLWIADQPDAIEHGLMHTTAEQMAPPDDGPRRGMLFVFDHEQYLSFWMKNTIIPLDVAYLTTDGTVVSTYTMSPLDTRIGQYRSDAPARFAIEVNAGVWAELGLEPGDQVDIPSSVLKGTP